MSDTAVRAAWTATPSPSLRVELEAQLPDAPIIRPIVTPAIDPRDRSGTIGREPAIETRWVFTAAADRLLSFRMVAVDRAGRRHLVQEERWLLEERIAPAQSPFASDQTDK